jgi:hypothetical protein
MKTTSTDFNYIHQIPETLFEQELLRRFIQQAMPAEVPVAFSSERATTHIGDEWQDGWLHFGLSFTPAGENFDPFFDQESMKGRVRIVEEPHPASEAYRVCVQWEMPEQVSSQFQGAPGRFFAVGGQMNHLPYLPVIGKQSEAK